MTAIVLAVLALQTPGEWSKVRLPSPRDVELGGPLGEDLRRGLDRLARPPFDTAWILSDVSFEVKRIFTNYSGDASGRFLELASLTSPRDASVPPALDAVVERIGRYQRPDGHFGADFDLSKPLEKNTVNKTAPLPMFWGNARLLVGLVTAARERNRPELLEAAAKLGDFYVGSADLMCSPAREAEYKSTGTYGDSYVCDYFPAMEGLALLYHATGKEKYLAQARRMADFFMRFDALPIDHSHGNLCAWRSILMLHESTGEKSLLAAARAKWEAAVNGGYIWPIGGLGEHWHVKYHITEACSESDWLRFNLDLWRFTGETRYLDMAERVLHNQYRINQCPNGGFGSRHLEADSAGPFAVKPKIDEWYFCCGFHGPLGLHLLKPYLAASSDRGIFVNFLLPFRAMVPHGENMWDLKVERLPSGGPDEKWSIALTTAGGPDRPRPKVWIRAAGRDGYLPLAGDGVVTLAPAIGLEQRRFRKISPAAGIHRDVAILHGSRVLFAAAVEGAGRPTILVPIGEGRIPRLPEKDGGFAAATLPSAEADEAAVEKALESGPAVLLRPWGSFVPKRRAPFMFDVVAVPASRLDEKKLREIAERAASADGPVFGDDLEKRRELWPEIQGWSFKPEGILVSGGDVGLLQAEGYEDYRLEFEIVLPHDGQGISGWLVRARGPEDAVMFQIQSADSTFHAPEYKTKPNTLRPHLRRGGRWTLLDPLPLPATVKRGESHRVAVECRGESVEVFLDGARVCSMRVPDHRQGGIGFRAAGPAEQGLFRKISLRKSH